MSSSTTGLPTGPGSVSEPPKALTAFPAQHREARTGAATSSRGC